MNLPFAVDVSKQKDSKEKTANTVAALSFMITLQGESLFIIKLLFLRMNRFLPKTHLSERQLCVDFLSRSTALTTVFSHLRIIDKHY
eukprot:scaffold21910_cov86-Amphora_coffeaeformis.AAC.1